jgi:hypothetical protein
MDTFLMTGDAREAPQFGPPAIPIHNNGDMFREGVEI